MSQGCFGPAERCWHRMLRWTRKRSPQELGCVGFLISGRVALSALILVGVDLHVVFTFHSAYTVTNNFWGILVKVKVAQLRPQGLYTPWNSPGQNSEMVRPFIFPGDLSNPGIEPRSPALQVDSLPAEVPSKTK